MRPDFPLDPDGKNANEALGAGNEPQRSPASKEPEGASSALDGEEA